MLSSRPPCANTVPGCLLWTRQRSVTTGVSTDPAKPCSCCGPQHRAQRAQGSQALCCPDQTCTGPPSPHLAQQPWGEGQATQAQRTEGSPVPARLARGAVGPCQHSQLSWGQRDPRHCRADASISQASAPHAAPPPPQTLRKCFPSATEQSCSRRRRRRRRAAHTQPALTRCSSGRR